MVKTAISFALGCWLLLQLSSIPSTQWFWAILPAFLLLLYRKTRLLSVIILGALWTLFYASNVFNDRLASEFIGQDITITGTIISLPVQDDRRLSFEFSPDITSSTKLPTKLRLNWYRPFPDIINTDETWQLTVRLKQARGMMNPGTFDYEGWLFQRNIGATGYVRTHPENKRLSTASVLSTNALRQSLIERIVVHFSDSENLGLIQGLTTGIRHNISHEQWQTLRLSGTSHLLAISGLHIGLAAAIGFFSFKWLWSRRANNLLLLASKEAGAIGGFITALFYAAMAGFSIPSQRALIMVTTLMLTLIIRKPAAISSILAVSLFVILVHNPLAILSVGFWLSFSAVAIILFISQNRFPAPKWQWAKIHTLIAFGLTPLLLLFFMQTSVIAPIANFVAVPVVSLLVVPLLLLGSLFLWLFEPIGVVLFQCADFLLGLLWPLLEFLAALPFAHWSSLALPTLYWLSIMLGTTLLLTPTKFPAKWLGLIGLMPLVLYSPDQPDKDEFWFTLLDVGQGLSAVIQTQNHTLVFDTGPKFSDNFDTGSAVVSPFLQQQGINHIDTLIISHGDNDHIGGAVSLIEKVAINSIISSVPELLPSAEHCVAGQSWQWDGITFSFLHPRSDDHGSENNLSCVLKVSTGNNSVLLTGDIESKTESLLVQRYHSQLVSTLLVAPHHGSKTSSTAAFIDAVNPEIVLFPVGYRNRYGFPKDEVVNRYRTKNRILFDSAQSGAIQYRFEPKTISKPVLWRQQAKRIWTAVN
ncbi:MAG: DNA internalization-related competence protein ComEC/Rec2 [Methylophaga sp.]|nr:MAG: DNA internalization-related competence protein ComEC/Rec2 [Methylophaga sp.]